MQSFTSANSVPCQFSAAQKTAALQCYTELMQAEKAVGSCITDNKSCRYSHLHESQTSGPL